ncbi:MAG TPA: zinc ribbon domain-containing protein [Polyangiaceae bacterium]|jgi:putative FmdB family regulatory protein
MTYEYVCTSCGHAWEAEQSISAAPLKVCPHCGQEHAKRQVSGGAGFILKGGGWYADGYGSAKPSSGGSGNGSSGSAKSETTPAAAEPKVAGTTETKSADSKSVPASTTSTS